MTTVIELDSKPLWDILKLSGKKHVKGENRITRNNWEEWHSDTVAKVISDTGKTVVLENMYNKKRYTLHQSKAKDNKDGYVYTAIIDNRTYFSRRPEIGSIGPTEATYNDWLSCEDNKPTDENQV